MVKSHPGYSGSTMTATHQISRDLGWEYLEKLRINGTVHDEVLAVVSDIEMPRMDGHNLCKRIKENDGYEGIPVMLFSSLVNDLARHKGDAVGADDQIAKPELGQLVTRLQACLHNLTT
jgi:two-component system chemotaxis response regulator CheV